MVYNAHMQPQYYGAAAEYNKPKNFRFDKRIVILLGLVLIVALIIFIASLVIGSLTNGPRDNLARLIAREQQIVRFIDTNEANLKDSELKRIGSDTILYLGTDTAALRKLLSGGISEEISKQEADSTSAAKLKAAIQANKHDQTYLEILRDKIAAALELAKTVQAENNGKIKTATDQTVKNLQTQLQQLDALD